MWLHIICLRDYNQKSVRAWITLFSSVGDCDPLKKHWISTSFSFLWIILDAEQQDLHCVNFILLMWNTVQNGERGPHVFTEHWLEKQKKWV